jgi:hypothetical protein
METLGKMPYRMRINQNPYNKWKEDKPWSCTLMAKEGVWIEDKTTEDSTQQQRV